MSLTIDVVSDVVCPWCYIGKRKLEAALDLYKENNPGAPAPVVTWHPFQLNPDMPKEGIPRDEYVKRKFGPERAKTVYNRVTGVGAEAGIPFAFDKVVRQPNTLAAHSLIALAADNDRQDAAVEAFFRAYFLDGRDLTSNDTLVEIAASAGVDQDEAKAVLEAPEARENVEAEDRQARELGVEGVPFFIFNRKLAVSGAQPAEVLLQAMLEAEKQPTTA